MSKKNILSQKHILKKFVSPHLPVIPGEFKKRGFYTPIREWFFSKKHLPELKHYLSKHKIEETGLFNPETVDTQLNTLLAMPAANDLNSYYRSMQLEWSMMLVLTTQMLHQLYITKEAPCFHDINTKEKRN